MKTDSSNVLSIASEKTNITNILNVMLGTVNLSGRIKDSFFCS